MRQQVRQAAGIVDGKRDADFRGGHHIDGNAMIVDPWGEVLARAPGDGETFVAAELDFDRLHHVRAKLPSLQNRVPGAYRWPSEVHA